MSQSNRPTKLRPNGELFAERRQGLLDERYFDIKDMGHTTPCWVWKRTTVGERGYGQAWSKLGRYRTVAHRVVWEERVGPWPEGMQADHLCRVRLCVNPDHIEPVTQSVNQRRGLNGKLSVEEIAHIHERRKEGLSIMKISKEFSVTTDTVKRHLKIGGRHGVRNPAESHPTEP